MNKTDENIKYDYQMFQYDTESPDEIKAILARYIKKHGKPPQIVEVSKDVNVKLDGVPTICLQCVQKGLVYLGEEQKGDEK